MTDSILRTYQYSASTSIVPVTLRVNLVDKTQAVNDTIWSKINVTITADSLTAPDGTSTADKVTQTAVANDLYQLLHTFAGDFTGSVFLKPITTCQWIRFTHSDGLGAGVTAWFDILNGVPGTTSVQGGWTVSSTSIQAAGGGWYRCIVPFNKTLSNAQVFTEVITANADASITGSASGTEYGVWGWQVQAGTLATEYEPWL